MSLKTILSFLDKYGIKTFKVKDEEILVVATVHN